MTSVPALEPFERHWRVVLSLRFDTDGREITAGLSEVDGAKRMKAFNKVRKKGMV